MLGKVVAVRFVITTIVLALIGLGLGFGFYNVALGGTPKVAVFDGALGVIDDDLTAAIKVKLNFIADDPDIKAVVVRINSPGGSASASEELYTSLAKLRESKPVVVSVQGIAASGSYMMSLGANEIYSNGTMIVGSIGAILSPPGPSIPSEFVLATGPFKLSGGSERTYTELLEEMKEAFWFAVSTERGDRLVAPRSEVLSGKIWLGLDAFRMGLIDAIGDESDAIDAAVRLAGLNRYEILNVEEAMEAAGGSAADAVAVAQSYEPVGDFDFDTTDSQFPYIHYLYLPPQ